MPEPSAIAQGQRRRTLAHGVAYPMPSTPYATTIMKANPSRDTGPELRIRSALHARGLHYRVNQSVRVDDGRPILVDVVFPKGRLAVFIDGCFWHGCPSHGTIPKANIGYWLPKLQRNAERDIETVARLENAGWRALRIWEHDDPQEAAEHIALTLDCAQGDNHPTLGAMPETVRASPCQ